MEMNPDFIKQVSDIYDTSITYQNDVITEWTIVNKETNQEYIIRKYGIDYKIKNIAEKWDCLVIFDLDYITILEGYKCGKTLYAESRLKIFQTTANLLKALIQAKKIR